MCRIGHFIFLSNEIRISRLHELEIDLAEFFETAID